MLDALTLVTPLEVPMSSHELSSLRVADRPKQLDHLPIVAQALRRLGLAQLIDERIPLTLTARPASEPALRR